MNAVAAALVWFLLCHISNPTRFFFSSHLSSFLSQRALPSPWPKQRRKGSRWHGPERVHPPPPPHRESLLFCGWGRRGSAGCHFPYTNHEHRHTRTCLCVSLCVCLCVCVGKNGTNKSSYRTVQLSTIDPTTHTHTHTEMRLVSAPSLLPS